MDETQAFEEELTRALEACLHRPRDATFISYYELATLTASGASRPTPDWTEKASPELRKCVEERLAKKP